MLSNGKTTFIAVSARPCGLTAVSTKVVQKKRQSVRDNAER